MTKSGETTFDSALSGAFFIGLLSSGAYWLAFIYEVGYLGAFGIPPHLAQVKLESIMITALAMLAAVWFLYLLGNMLAMAWPAHPALQEKLVRVALLLLFPLWHLLNYGFRKQDWIAYLIVIALIAGFELIWPLVFFRDRQSLREKFIADETAESRWRERGILGRVYASFGPVAYWLLMLFAIGTWLVYNAGKAKALTQEEYLLLADQRTIAIVRMYPDMIIGMPFRLETKEIEPRIVIRKVGSEEIHIAMAERIGPLRLKAHKTPKESAVR